MPKQNIALREIDVRNAKPREQNYFLFDREGLRLLIRPSGTKVWQLPYIYNGKNNIYTIGRYPRVTMSEARERVPGIKKLLGSGINPNQTKRADKQANIEASLNTFEAIARDWYAQQHWAAKHAKNVISRLEKDVFPVIGFIPITKVNVPDIVGILQKIDHRGAGDVARRIGHYCSAIFEYAIAKGLCEQNPAMGRARILKPLKRKNRAHLNEGELPKFLKKLDAAVEKNALITLAVKLLVLTMLRPGEVREARWDEIDEEKALWSIPVERMKRGREHIVPLSTQALEVIRKLRPQTGNKALLFPGQRPGKPFSDVALIKVVKALTDNKATPHGFRHTASTLLHEHDFHSDHIEMQLSHVEENKVKGTYNKALYLEQRTKMVQWWADHLDELRERDNG
jgi:integrase